MGASASFSGVEVSRTNSSEASGRYVFSMKFLVYAVGHKMPEWIAAGFQEYAKRMPREAAIELLEIKPERRDSGKKMEQLLAAEGARYRAVKLFRQQNSNQSMRKCQGR